MTRIEFQVIPSTYDFVYRKKPDEVTLLLILLISLCILCILPSIIPYRNDTD